MDPAQFGLWNAMPDVAAWSQSKLLSLGVAQFYTFSLVFVRISGLMLIGPLLGQSAIPPQIRILLILTCALLVTPTLPNQAQRAFAQLDQNHDGRLMKEEVPEILRVRFETVNSELGKPKGLPITRSEWSYRFEAPQSLLAWAIAGIRELSFGFVLGLGLSIVFSGLQLAGELIDQQTGIGLSGVFNPGFDMSAGVSGQALYLFGVIVFLTMPPISGHLLVISALLDTFQAVPLGEAWVGQSAVDLMSDLVHQSLVLGIQVAAPVLAAMAFTALTMGFLSHTVPQINVLNLGFPVRAIINICILSLSLTGTAYLLIELIPVTIQQLKFQLLPY